VNTNEQVWVVIHAEWEKRYAFLKKNKDQLKGVFNGKLKVCTAINVAFMPLALLAAFQHAANSFVVRISRRRTDPSPRL
jgi:hypothetical protein